MKNNFKKEIALISTSGCSLSMGRELSLLGRQACGVSAFPHLP